MSWRFQLAQMQFWSGLPMLKLPAMKFGQFAALLMLLDQPTHAWLVLSEQQFLRWPVQFAIPNLAYLEQLLL